MAKLLPLSRVARYLSVTEADVEAWTESGQLVPSVELPNGERRWRRDDLLVWIDTLPTARPRLPEAARPVAEAKSGTSELAGEMLRVLREAGGGWMAGEDLAASIGEDTDCTSGTWKREVRLLKQAGLIETDRHKGYRLVGPTAGPTKNNSTQTDG